MTSAEPSLREVNVVSDQVGARCGTLFSPQAAEDSPQPLLGFLLFSLSGVLGFGPSSGSWAIFSVLRDVWVHDSFYRSTDMLSCLDDLLELVGVV